MVVAATDVLDNKTATVSRLAARDTMAFMVFLLRNNFGLSPGEGTITVLLPDLPPASNRSGDGPATRCSYGGLKLYPCALLIWSRYEQSPAAVVCVWVCWGIWFLRFGLSF